MRRRCRGKACTSEFDYAGWSTWGQWRANELRLRGEDDMIVDDDGGVVHQNCEKNCRYPSQCRWGISANVPTTVGVLVERVVVDANEEIDAGDTTTESAEVLTSNVAVDVDGVSLGDIASDLIRAAF